MFVANIPEINSFFPSYIFMYFTHPIYIFAVKLLLNIR